MAPLGTIRSHIRYRAGKVHYRREIDGLRAVAVVPVVLFHAGSNLFSGGYVGVDVFFVISGYLITTIILQDRAAGRFSIARFYERRARRILPALIFVLAVTFPLAWAFMMPDPFHDYMRSLAFASLFLSNVHFWETTGYFAEAAELRPLLHTWSLAVEEQYYLLIPLLMAALGAITFRKYLICFVVIALMSLLLSEWGWRNHPSANFFFTFSRFWELFIGSICAIISFKRQIKGNQGLSALGLAMILVSVFAYGTSIPAPSVYLLLPVLGAALVVLFARQGTLVAHVLSMRVFVGLGLISYSTYLWHQPLFVFARIASPQEPTTSVMIVLTVAAIVLAAFTWRFVEQPLRVTPARILRGRSALFAASLSGILAFAALGFAGQMGGPVQSRAAQAMPATLLQAEHDHNDYASCLPRGANFDLGHALKACSVETDADRTVVLMGDSHADHYGAALRRGAEELGYDFIQLTANSCTPFSDFYPSANDCDTYAAGVADFLAETRADVIVLSQRWTVMFEHSRFDNGQGGIEHGEIEPYLIDDLTPGTDAYKDALFERVAMGLESLFEQSKVVLVGPSPEAGWNVPRQLQKMVLSGSSGFQELELSTSYKRFKERNDEVLDRFSELDYPELYRFDPHEALCNRQVEGRCVNVWQGTVIYHDDDHLSRTGAMFIAPDLLEVIQQALEG